MGVRASCVFFQEHNVILSNSGTESGADNLAIACLRSYSLNCTATLIGFTTDTTARYALSTLLIVKVSKGTLKGATKIEVFLDQTILKRFFRMRFFLYEKTFEGFFSNSDYNTQTLEEYFKKLQKVQMRSLNSSVTNLIKTSKGANAILK